MAQKKEDLPVNADVDLQNGGTITYATEVISTIAGVAANEIEGIAGMCISGGLSDIIGRNRNITRGVKVEIGSEEASFDLYVIVEYGQPIQKVCHDVQENVRKAIESMTGLHVARVDVHVQGVSFEKEKQAQEIGIEASKNPALTAGSGETAAIPDKAGDRPAETKASKPRKKKAAKEAGKRETDGKGGKEPVKESPAAEAAQPAAESGAEEACAPGGDGLEQSASGAGETAAEKPAAEETAEPSAAEEDGGADGKAE